MGASFEVEAGCSVGVESCAFGEDEGGGAAGEVEGGVGGNGVLAEMIEGEAILA